MKTVKRQWRSLQPGLVLVVVLVTAILTGCRLSGFVLGIKDAAISRSGDPTSPTSTDVDITNVVVLPVMKQ